MAHDIRWRAMLLFGMPGSGKGTQGQAIGSIPPFFHVSTGDIFRQLYKAGPLGREVERFTSVGKLVPDELTVQIFFNHMDLHIRKQTFLPDRNIILADGIPRTREQARMIAEKIDVVRILFLKLPDEEEAVQRIKRRAIKEGRLDDADESVIRDRLATFHRQTADALSYYDDSLITEINAADSPIAVLAELAREINTALVESTPLSTQQRS
ncbi:nucleoside monophosphate kinase [bacterium]|nr:nucleoside monophosphate kinase [bacterium]